MFKIHGRYNYNISTIEYIKSDILSTSHIYMRANIEHNY